MEKLKELEEEGELVLFEWRKENKKEEEEGGGVGELMPELVPHRRCWFDTHWPSVWPKVDDLKYSKSEK